MAIVNGRPLNTLDDGITPPTPNQLLTMKSKHIPPPPGQLDQNDMYSNKRWRQVQRLANSFWTKWETQYLHNLQGRQKWHKQQSNIHKGDIVLVKNKNTHRKKWLIASDRNT